MIFILRQSRATTLRILYSWNSPKGSGHSIKSFLGHPKLATRFSSEKQDSRKMVDVKHVVSYEDVLKMIHQPEKVIIDVRNPDEVNNTGKIPSSINIPLINVQDALSSMSEEEFKRQYQRAKPSPSNELIFYCHSGRRSSEALEKALKLGYSKMRTYKRKTERGTTSKELLQRAADAVIKEGRKLKTVARELEICHTTLQRFVKKIKEGQTPTVGYKPRVIFNAEQEEALASYILTCSSIYFGLLPEEIKKLAYECAIRFNVQNIPDSWHANGMAGKDWFTNFLKRNLSLSIRTPEATSAGRATSFNRHNVTQFFDKLGDVILKHKLTPSRIWNLDEAGVTTVLKPKKIVTAKGIKQVGAIVSAERGTLVTVELAANAIGNTIPPMFVFPRLKYKDLFIRDGPPECIGAGNSSGWMTSNEFFVFMDHFIKYTKPSPSEPVLLLLDNHSSHIDIKVVEKAKENSLIMLSFPPHCTHRLQPLDVGINGPFKTYCAKAQENWLRNNPGKTMTIYEIQGIVKYAWPLASTPTNICSAFKKAGIWPFDPNVFTDEDFAPSFVTDRLQPESQPALVDLSNEPGPSHIQQMYCPPEITNTNQTTIGEIAQERNRINSQEPSLQTPQNNDQQETVRANSAELVLKNIAQPGHSNDTATFSPEIIRPLPKVPPRLSAGNKRRIRKAAALSDTPEKNALAEEHAKKKKIEGSNTKVNRNMKENKSKGKEQRKKKINNGKDNKNETKRKILQEIEDTESEDEEDRLKWYCIICCDSYSNSKSNEKWIECVMCKNWAHLKCIKDEKHVMFLCPNCCSDESFSD